jgi:1,2-diacylglycerol 3-alpha-glucosyltransferase
MKVAVIFHRFGPYHCARLAAAARSFDLTAIELAAETSEYDWNKVSDTNDYSRVTLFGQGDSRAASAEEVSRRVGSALTESNPAAVAIPGWWDKGTLAALRWCAQNDRPAILMSESTAHDQPRVAWKEFVKRRIVAFFASALVGGERHAEYLIALGMKREQIFFGYDAVDNDYFAEKAKEARGQRSEIRAQYNLPENYFLASARFIPKKNLFTLIRAYARYREIDDSSLVTGLPRQSVAKAGHSSLWHLVLLGDGPLRDAINRELITLNLRDSVHLPGFKQYEELPVYYALANAFVHASRVEQWGLVVNEAMASGLPVIVSNRCGCMPELVREGVNGYTFDPANERELAEKLTMMSALSETERDQLAETGREIVANYGPERFAEGLVGAAQFALSQPRAAASRVAAFTLSILAKR